ncbi:hypothetical protein [Rhodopila sp.]|uniref:hypothetical protein n=1 Tax=Rhodopila sp. TaxID=2480087 RepID=UPI003D0EBC46
MSPDDKYKDQNAEKPAWVYNEAGVLVPRTPERISKDIAGRDARIAREKGEQEAANSQPRSRNVEIER